MKLTTTRSSASLLPSNLTTNGKHAAYVHDTDVIVLNESAVVSGSHSPSFLTVHPFSETDSSQVLQARFVHPPDAPVELLVLACSKSFFVYAPDGKKVIHTVPMVTSTDSNYFQGVAACTPPGSAESFLFVGTFAGDLCKLPIAGTAPVIGRYTFEKNLSTCVCDLAATSSADGSRLVVSSGDTERENIALVIYDVSADGACTEYAAFQSEDGGIYTAVRIFGIYVICATSTGHVRVYDLEAKQLCAVVCAHARWIRAMEVHPASGLVATASEDTYLGLWRIKDQGGFKIQHVSHIHAPDCLLTGVAIVGDGSAVAATAYDVDAVMAWPVSA